MSFRAAQAGVRVQEVASREQPGMHAEDNLNVSRNGGRIAGLIVSERLFSKLSSLRFSFTDLKISVVA